MRGSEGAKRIVLRIRHLVKQPWLLFGGVAVGFVVLLTFQLSPPDPESRLPGSQRLAALIARQQEENTAQTKQVAALRQQLQDERDASANQEAGLTQTNSEVTEASRLAGTIGMKGSGFTVTLADSTLASSPSGNVNDLVIHSQDVQAVVNAMWAAGAEAIAINDERVVSTSAILCVGNTLLLNGTVHAPPYEIAAIGANRSVVLDDPLVKRLSSAAQEFSLRFSVGKQQTITVPAYSGAIAPRYAAVAS